MHHSNLTVKGGPCGICNWTSVPFGDTPLLNVKGPTVFISFFSSVFIGNLTMTSGVTIDCRSSFGGVNLTVQNLQMSWSTAFLKDSAEGFSFHGCAFQVLLENLVLVSVLCPLRF